MPVNCRLPSLLALLSLIGSVEAAPERVHYDMDIGLDPPRHDISVESTINLPAASAGQRIEFLLASALAISNATPPVEPIARRPGDGFTGINGSSAQLGEAVARYAVTVPRDGGPLRLRYRGRIDFPPQTAPEEYARSFRETPGLIGPEGVYLAGSTLWYPFFGDELVTFTMKASAPRGWELISAGNGVSRGDEGTARWESGGPVDEIHLAGGPLKRYANPAGGVAAEVYLRQPDAALASTYLEATVRYIEMYRRLIGPYPYGKFALVENFWETGYGMPSFTLLGPQVIRFPFILTSSYPHEILHNWWGNSVFVNYATGNWAEGLTAYLADHLFKEQAGQGAEYRRDTLKRYRDFVAESRDFPLAEFRSRHSAATEAVGYGKTMMGFHMLRQRLGDTAFRNALSSFYGRYRGQRAEFSDLRAEFERAGRVDLQRFFDEWVNMPGAADLALEEVVANGNRVQGVIRQRQPKAFDLEVPIVVFTAQTAVRERVRSADVTTPFAIDAAASPRAVALDPEFDLFRRLDHRETAPSVGELFGESALFAVLPAAESAAHREAYRSIISAWAGDTQKITVISDEDAEIPPRQSAWLFGRQNRLAARLFTSDPPPGFDVEADALRAGSDRVPFAGHSAVVVRRHPRDPSKALGWIVVDPLAAAPGVARKLPHYGKYSYLGFEGTEPVNHAKGEWPITDSPLQVRFDSGKTLAPLPAREALADLPPAFSRDRLLAHVRFLADPALEGRGLGSAGLEKAAEYIAREFAAAGLEPAGSHGWFQQFTAPTGPDGQPHEIRNVLAVVAGTDPAFAGQAVLISAHYDHLGLGWPDVRADARGQIYPGADDNASGVAVLIELARAFAAGPPPRSLVFAAFTAEEAGRLGSIDYVSRMKQAGHTAIRGVVNLDTVGRLGTQPVQVLASASASEWPHIFRGVSATTGIASKIIEGASQSSDQQSFIDAGIPAVQICTGAHFDYHRPGDTANKVDADGLVKIAAFVREAAAYLAVRPEPLTFSGAAAATVAAPGPNAARRRVSLGTVPDFAFGGPGVRVESVVPGSPAEQAGIRAGDIITALGGKPVADLSGYSEILTAYAAGQSVQVVYTRNSAQSAVDITLQAR
jgi:hypothetical protein